VQLDECTGEATYVVQSGDLAFWAVFHRAVQLLPLLPLQARWGNSYDPTGMQYVLRPLQSGAMPPSWRVRFPVNNMPHIIQGTGGGAGGCNNQGPMEFNGAAIAKVTCMIKWFGPGSGNSKLEWYCVDG